MPYLGQQSFEIWNRIQCCLKENTPVFILEGSFSVKIPTFHAINFKSTKCSIIQALRNRYDNRVVKLVRELERLDYKTRKCKIDLEFFNLSVENNVIPKFIQLHVGNKELRNSVARRKCLNKLLQQEVINKKRRYKLLEKDLKSVKTNCC